MNSAYEVDFDALLRVVHNSDHLIVRFSTVGQRLFLDFRTSAQESPGVYLLGTADSREERLATIAAAQPNFARPAPLSVLAWPLRVGSLGQHERLEQMRTMDAAYAALLETERDEVCHGDQRRWLPHPVGRRHRPLTAAVSSPLTGTFLRRAAHAS